MSGDGIVEIIIIGIVIIIFVLLGILAIIYFKEKSKQKEDRMILQKKMKKRQIKNLYSDLWNLIT